MRMAKRFGSILAALIVVVFLLGCSTQPETVESEEQEQKQEQEQQAEETTQQQETTEEKTEETAEGQEEAEPEFTTVRIQFQADSAALLDQERQKLLSYAPVLREYPDLQLLVKGHAARFGEEESSQVLSGQRAQRVADFIVEQGGVDASQLTVVGVGSREPEADNSTPSGRARNRRVVISVLDY